MKFNSVKPGLIIASLLLTLVARTQSSDPVLLNVAGENITKGEFLKVFQKNNIKGESLDRTSLDEYLDLYINFRLKVKEATTLGMDTLKSFKDELSSYRKQLAQPYLTDDVKLNELINEAYQNKLYDVRASHILIRVERASSAADTLAAWNKINQLRKRLMKGEDFGKLAVEFSDDPSVKDQVINGRAIKGNKGDLGFFTAFDMVYPFEKAAYSQKIGEISMPIRTDYGYHLLKVTQKLPSINKIQLAHVMLMFPENGTLDDSLKVADSANIAYKQLKGGIDFASVAKKFSDDKTTSDKGGVLPWYGVNRLLPEFVNAIALLKNKGDYSEPFSSNYGWHIIKLVDRKPVGKFEEEKDDLKQRVNKNDRSYEVAKSFVNLTRKEYGYSMDSKALDEITKSITDSIFNGTWKAPENLPFNKTLFTIGDRQVPQSDFVAFLQTSQRKAQISDIPAFVNFFFNDFMMQTVMKYADSQLENKYPDFKALMSEYHDGILLFDLTDKKVWSKAVKDTTGLENFYQSHKNNYLWDQRLEASIFTLKNEKDVKAIRKYFKKGLTDEVILSKFNRDSIPAVTAENKKWLKGENHFIDNVSWQKGYYGPFAAEDNRTVFIRVSRVVDPEPKQLSEIKGIITADYQNYLEKQWIDELRSKYPYHVNRDVFESIFR